MTLTNRQEQWDYPAPASMVEALQGRLDAEQHKVYAARATTTVMCGHESEVGVLLTYREDHRCPEFDETLRAEAIGDMVRYAQTNACLACKKEAERA